MNLYIYDMFTCYVLSPLYIEENSVYYSSMNWERFSKNIFVAEFSAHERDVPERLSRKEVQMLGAGTRAAGGLGSPFTSSGSAAPSFPETQRRLPFIPAPSWLGCLGLQELLISPLCPSLWPEGPNSRLAEWPWPSLSECLTAAQFLLACRDLKTCLRWWLTTSVPFLLTKHLMGVLRLHHEKKLQGR